MGETKLLEKVSTEIKARHYSRKTEQVCTSWIQPVRYSEVSQLFCKMNLSHGIKTTIIYTYVLNRGIGVRSPLDTGWYMRIIFLSIILMFYVKYSLTISTQIS